MKLLSWKEILEELSMTDEELRYILSDAIDGEHYCDVVGISSRTETEECPYCHKDLFHLDYIGDFIGKSINKHFYKKEEN